MMKKEPESWDAAWNDLDRAFSISCKPTAKRVPKGYVFDEDKSVRWNAEQVESHNVEIQKEVSEKQKARSLLSIKPQMLLLPLLLMNFMVRLTVSKPKLSGILPMKDCIYLWKIVKVALSW